MYHILPEYVTKYAKSIKFIGANCIYIFKSSVSYKTVHTWSSVENFWDSSSGNDLWAAVSGGSESSAAVSGGDELSVSI